ncbi:MAG: hypothetical protein ACRC6I_17520 [Paracoccaceae bacterium]
MRKVAAFLALMVPAIAGAETASYGDVELTGLARESWPLNPPGPSFAMVCNVNGPDGFLTIRAAPDSAAASQRMLKRLAIVEVDTGDRRGHWVRVLGAHRVTDENGREAPYRDLPVRGWAHDDYLCDFID